MCTCNRCGYATRLIENIEKRERLLQTINNLNADPDFDRPGFVPPKPKGSTTMTTSYWFGRHAPETAIRAWGARAIYHQGARNPIELLWDRQSYKPDEPSDHEFESWINTVALPWLRAELNGQWVPSNSEQVFTFESGKYVIEASPQRSFGYI